IEKLTFLKLCKVRKAQEREKIKEPDTSRPSFSASNEFKNFEDLAKRLISVSKKEIDKKAKEYKRQKQRRIKKPK
ncbi:MAG: hypothetical protein M3R15_13200, partial [Acidobacteriota bacterium]|nr:hypothetical protein [Acidobacteriota bacterium]